MTDMAPETNEKLEAEFEWGISEVVVDRTCNVRRRTNRKPFAAGYLGVRFCRERSKGAIG